VRVRGEGNERSELPSAILYDKSNLLYSSSALIKASTTTVRRQIRLQKDLWLRMRGGE